MKKILLSAVALVAAMSVNAQTEVAGITKDIATNVGFVIGDDGKASAKIKVAAGTELLKSESVTVTLLYDQDETNMTGLSKNDVLVNGEKFGSETGFQGNNNGPATALSGTFPESGCVYNFKVAKDGFLYVIHKGSNNKGYVVYEEKVARPSFLFVMSDGTKAASFDLSKIEGATFNDPEGGVYVNESYTILTPGSFTKNDVVTEGYVADMPSGTSVIKFQVFKDCNYQVLATGSKMTLAGFVFDTTGDATISIGDAEAPVVLLDKGQISGGEAGISNVKAEKFNGAIYNLAGQKVAANFKGIAIQNGKKVVLK